MKPQRSRDRNDPALDIDALMGSAQRASEFLKALAHEARLLILCMLLEEEKTVSEIEDALRLRQPAISQQLARLRAEGLVETRRDGKNIFYSLARPETREVIAALHRAFCEAPPVRERVRKPTLVRAAARAKGVRVRSPRGSISKRN